MNIATPYFFMEFSGGGSNFIGGANEYIGGSDKMVEQWLSVDWRVRGIGPGECNRWTWPLVSQWSKDGFMRS